tara:strand:+ start:4133 stop:4579 length:447 start_codon:yes stop_codon:yes gene_type:complete
VYTNTKRYKAIFVISGVNVENIDLLYLASAFLLGYIVRGTLAFLYNLGTMANFVKDITYELQGLIIGVAQDVEFIKEAKYQILDSAGADENLIKRERNMDEYSFNQWRNIVVKTYISKFPHKFKNTFVKFNDWDGMVFQFNEERDKRR